MNQTEQKPHGRHTPEYQNTPDDIPTGTPKWKELRTFPITLRWQTVTITTPGTPRDIANQIATRPPHRNGINMSCRKNTKVIAATIPTGRGDIWTPTFVGTITKHAEHTTLKGTTRPNITSVILVGLPLITLLAAPFIGPQAATAMAPFAALLALLYGQGGWFDRRNNARRRQTILKDLEETLQSEPSTHQIAANRAQLRHETATSQLFLAAAFFTISAGVLLWAVAAWYPNRNATAYMNMGATIEQTHGCSTAKECTETDLLCATGDTSDCENVSWGGIKCSVADNDDGLFCEKALDDVHHFTLGSPVDGHKTIKPAAVTTTLLAIPLAIFIRRKRNLST